MLKNKDYDLFQKIDLIVGKLIDRSTEHKKKTSIKMMRTRYGDFVADLTGDIEHRVRSE